MSEGERPATRWPGWRVLLQVGAAGVVGAVALPVGLGALVVLGWAGGSGVAVVVGVLYLGVVTALLVGVASLAPEVSRLTRTLGGRVGWALTVTVAGSLAWVFARAVFATGDTLEPSAFSFSFLPFALVAGLLVRQWYWKAGAAALSVASCVGLLAVLAGSVPAEADVRLDASGLDRGEVFVTQIPGYHRVPYQQVMRPDDDQVIPPERYVSLMTYLDDPTGDCQPHPSDSALSGAPCTVERPGLTYRVGAVDHEYFYRKGTVLLRIVGSIAVERDVLRAAVLAARPSERPGSYTTKIDGFESSGPGGPSGEYFVPKDKSLLPHAKNVEVAASSGSEAGACAEFVKAGGPSPYLECVTERPGLNYRRLADTHVYLVQRGSIEVRVTGGLGVDRTVLRDAALSARPATEEELLSMLPPGPPPDQSTIMGKLKMFANHLFG